VLEGEGCGVEAVCCCKTCLERAEIDSSSLMKSDELVPILVDAVLRRPGPLLMLLLLLLLEELDVPEPLSPSEVPEFEVGL